MSHALHPLASEFWDVHAPVGAILIVTSENITRVREAPYLPLRSKRYALEVGCRVLDLGAEGLQTAVLWPSGRAAYFSDSGAEPCRWVETMSGEVLLIVEDDGAVITLGGEYLDDAFSGSV